MKVESSRGLPGAAVRLGADSTHRPSKKSSRELLGAAAGAAGAAGAGAATAPWSDSRAAQHAAPSAAHHACHRVAHTSSGIQYTGNCPAAANDRGRRGGGAAELIIEVSAAGYATGNMPCRLRLALLPSLIGISLSTESCYGTPFRLNRES